MKVVLDTNIYISALTFGGRPVQLIQALVRDADWEILFSDAIVEETLRVLRDKFKWPPEELQVAEALIADSGTKVTPSQTLDAVPDDPDDNRILECAVEGKAQCVVSGDKHLLKLSSHGEIKILRVGELLELMRGQSDA